MTSLADPKFEISLLFASKADGILWAAVHGDNYHILSVSTAASLHKTIFVLRCIENVCCVTVVADVTTLLEDIPVPVKASPLTGTLYTSLHCPRLPRKHPSQKL